MKLWIYTIIASSIFLAPALYVQAQTPPCGNIITPADFYYEGDAAISNPIADCVNPFARTEILTGLFLNEIEIRDGDFLDVPIEGVGKYGFVGERYYGTINSASYYKKMELDYVQQKVEFFEPTNEDTLVAVSKFFNNDVRLIDKYSEILFANNPDPFLYDPNGVPLIDELTGRQTRLVFWELASYVPFNIDHKRRLLLPGEYIAVVDNSGGGGVDVSQRSILDIPKNLFSLLIPVAQAGGPVKAINFTLRGPVPEPTGASSVLFLPGIMGSRLYENSSECIGDGTAPATERERWFSLNTCEQLRLMMDTNGISINPIYTKSDQSAILATAYGTSVYQKFLTELAEWKQQELIADYAVMPYDWRLGLYSLLKSKRDASGKITADAAGLVQEGYLYQTLTKLATESNTGKVTIVAHSNGGLLAKALLAILERDNDPLAKKIDVVILVAVPQLGTPDALVEILHGAPIIPYLKFFDVVSQQTTRQLLGTMPFAYHLLPSADYFSGVGASVPTPVLTFDAGSLTTPWSTTYGSDVVTAQKMQDFMRSSSGRTVPAIDDLNNPAVVSGNQFNYANSIGLLVNGWVPATTTKVYEIAGIGVQTVSGLKYYTGRECGLLNPWCVLFNPKLLYKVNHTVDGDGAVVVLSALGMSTSSANVVRKWFNLDQYNKNQVAEFNHSSIFEIPEINSFIKNTISTTTTQSYQFITDTAPQISEGERLNFYLHSPLDMKMVFSDGSVLSSSTPVISGALYRRYGELQYISIPNTTSNKNLILNGVATGSFTLEIEASKNGSTNKRQSYSAIPSSTSTRVTIPMTDSAAIEKIVLEVDYDGNGITDVSYDTVGQVVTYKMLRDTVNSLTLAPFYKKVLIETIKIAEQNYQKSLTKTQFKKVEKITLQILRQQVVVYGKLRLLSVSDQQKLLNIIDALLTK